MQIQSGWAKGTKLSVPKGHQTRPTSAKARAAFFDSIMSKYQAQTVAILDIFAGSGALGLEALSRGFLQARFVENDATALKALRENIALVMSRGEKQQITVTTDVFKVDAWKKPSFYAPANSFDVIYLDPPYAQAAKCWTELVPALSPALKDQGVIGVEAGEEMKALDFVDLELVQVKKYGLAYVHFVAKTANVTSAT